MRIGVITDTHAPEFLPGLPPGTLEALEGVDLILHCGDITGREIVEELETVAPVHAVSGNHDPAGTDYPRTRVVEAGGYRFGLVHGDGSGLGRNIIVSGINALVWRWTFITPGFADYVIGQIGEPVDVVVCGHIHRPFYEQRGETHVFSPGAIYMPQPKLLKWARQHRWRPKERDWVQQILGRVWTPLAPPAVGLIQAEPEGLRFERVELPAFR